MPSPRLPADPAPRPAARVAVTVHDVARAAGVSAMTVSRVLRTPQQVSERTRLAVQDAVRTLGYVPNLVANGLRSSRSNLVSALVPTVQGSLFSGMVGALTEALERRGFQLTVGQIGYGRSREDALLRAIVGRRPDGIVLTGILHSPESRTMLAASGIPVVETWDATDDPIDMLLRVSHDAIGRAVCDYLHARGKRRLAVLTGGDPRALRRADGLAARAAERGLPAPPVHLLDSPTTHRHGREGLRALLAATPAVDGVFCSSDMMAGGVLTEARALGIAVPEQLAVVGFGDLDFAATLLPSLTSVHIDGAAIGALAADMIAARADGAAVAERTVDIAHRIVPRDSA